MSCARSRGWCFTINNPTREDDNEIERLKEHAVYFIRGKEHGNEGTLHYQGFVRFKDAKALARVKKLLSRAHLERQRGTSHQAADYCKKDGDFIEHGTPPKEGKESSKERWQKIIQLAENGKTDQLRDEFPHAFFMFRRRIHELRKREIAILPELTNEWWVGPTGTGKSKKLWAEYPGHYQKSANKWWDNYEDQEVVAIEELEPESCKYLGRLLKIWADRYPFSPEIKGGSLTAIRPIKIIVLSNYTIEQCFPAKEDYQPLLRRFKVIKFISL